MNIDKEFKKTMLSQAKGGESDHDARLKECCDLAEAFAMIQGGIAVISDFPNDRSYIYSGQFGQCLDFGPYMELDSAFEDIIFSFIDTDEVLDRHILELRYLEFLKSLPCENRYDYIQSSKINLKVGHEEIPVIHQNRYLVITEEGNMNIGLCTYLPIGIKLTEAYEGQILNLKTGQILSSEQLHTVDSRILSTRESEVLGLLSKGLASKQIAAQLNISLNTVYRHRQNILQHLNVVNTAEAVRIGLKMKLI